MSYLSESLLSQYADRRIYGICESRYQADATVFLSHSHKDRCLVKGLINYLTDKGIKVYVDWNDGNMPRVTNKETAEIIKKQIKYNSFFWILATSNAMNSRWVPWETGIADQAKNDECIAVIPVSDSSGKYNGNEYMQLYRRIIISDEGGLAIFKPNESRGQGLSYFTKQAGNI